MIEMDNFFEQTEFADNPEPRCPVVLLLDTSQSMQGAPINELNEGLHTFEQVLKGDILASLRVEVAIITFGERCKLLMCGEKMGDIFLLTRMKPQN